jgi:hypothetical protein
MRFKIWAVTVIDVQRGEPANAAIKKANQFNDAPAEGFEYVLATLKVTNISTESKAQDPSFGVDIRLTGDRHLLYNNVSVVPPKPFKGELLPKGSAEGQSVFMVPSDERSLMFRISDSLPFDEDSYRFVALDPAAKLIPPDDLTSIAVTDVGAAKDMPAKMKDPVIAGSYQVTVLETIRGEDAAAKIKDANQFNDPAPDGQEYIAVKVRVRYLGGDKPDTSVSIDSSLFKITGEKNVVYDHPSVVPPKPTLDAHAFPGGETEGWIALSVDSGEKDLVLIVQPLFSFSDDEMRYIAIP